MLEDNFTLLNSPHPNSLKELRGKIIPPDGVRRKTMLDTIPADEGHELFDDENITDAVGDEGESDEARGDEESLSGDKPIEAGDDAPVDAEAPVEEYVTPPELVEDFKCLERIQKFIEGEKEQASANILPLFVKLQNNLSSERKRCRVMAKQFNKPKRSRPNNTPEGEPEERSAFDIFD